MVRVSIVNLSKVFGKTEAIRDISLEIRSGEFFVLLGPSGSGKSTLLNCIAGILKPDKGEIWIGDQLVASAERKIFVPPQERNLGMVFQDYALYPHMKVFDNIAFPLRIRKYSESEISKRVKEISEVLGISHLLEKKPAQLSGGERQRVALARALIRNPPLLLMDEPLSNLDAKLRTQMRVELKRIQKEFNTTVIYVTHDQVEAMSMGDRIGIIEQGRLQQVGEPLEIYDKPANTFVAGFIGSPPMNMFYCHVVDPVEGIISCNFGDIRLEKTQAQVLAESMVKEVIVGIRPENIKVAETSSGARYHVKILYLERLGKEMIAHISLGEERATMIIPPQLDIHPGSEITVEFDISKVKVFDKTTSKAIIV